MNVSQTRLTRGVAVGDTGFEPVTSSVSGKRASRLRQSPEVETGFEPAYTDLQSVASPLGHSTGEHCSPRGLGETRSERTTGLEPATLTLAR
jgi:hypothetical protein